MCSWQVLKQTPFLVGTKANPWHEASPHTPKGTLTILPLLLCRVPHLRLSGEKPSESATSASPEASLKVPPRARQCLSSGYMLSLLFPAEALPGNYNFSRKEGTGAGHPASERSGGLPDSSCLASLQPPGPDSASCAPLALLPANRHLSSPIASLSRMLSPMWDDLLYVWPHLSCRTSNLREGLTSGSPGNKRTVHSETREETRGGR